MVFKEKNFAEVAPRMGLRAMLRLLPWASLTGAILFMLSLFAQIAPERWLPYYRVGYGAMLVWPLAMEMAVLRSLRRRCREKATLYAVLVLGCLQGAYGAVLDNIQKPDTLGVAVIAIVLPVAASIPPKHYRILLGAMLGILVLVLLPLQPDRQALVFFAAQSAVLCFFSALLQFFLYSAKLQVFRVLSRIQKENRHLSHAALSDALTGLANRRHFQDRLQVEWGRSRRYGHPFALLSLDLDHFKRINDTQGHPFGDRVLRELGEILGHHIRECDMAARLGGEEFMVLLVECTREGAYALAERLRLAIPAMAASAEYGRPITASIGLVLSTEGDNLHALQGLVDERLYMAKQGGRDRVVGDAQPGFAG